MSDHRPADLRPYLAIAAAAWTLHALCDVARWAAAVWGLVFGR